MPSTKEQMQKAKARFYADTKDHAMTVHLKQSQYRHIRFAEPNTSMYLFEIVSFPYHLVISGDVPTFVFRREPDMLKFFERGGETPDPVYLEEKLVAGKDQTRNFSVEAYRERVQEWLKEQYDECDDFEQREQIRLAVENDLLHAHPWDSREAYEILASFEVEDLTIPDPFEWDLTEWDGSFLWCLWAIHSGIKRYLESGL